MKSALWRRRMFAVNIRPWKSWPLALRCALFAVAYFCGAHLGKALSFREGDFSTCWPPAGLMMGALLAHRRREWLAFGGAAVVAGVGFEWAEHGHQPALGFAFALGNFLQAALGAWVLELWCRRRPSMRRVNDVCKLATAALVTPAVSATAGLLATRLFFPDVIFSQLWPLWWSADALGILLVAPLVLAVLDADAPLPSRRPWLARLGESAALLAAVTFLADAAFAPEGSRWLLFAFPYMTFPGLLWAAMRLGTRSAAACSLTIGCLATWHTAVGAGAFVRPGRDVHEAAMLLQTFVVMTQFFALLPTAIMSQWRLAEGKVQALNVSLEQRVASRTAELEQSEAALREARDHLEVRVAERTAELELAQAHFTAFVENSPAAVFMKDSEGRMVFANQRMLDAYQMTRAELIGKTDHDWLPAEAADQLRAVDLRVARENKPHEVIESVVAPDGTQREWLSFKFPVPNRDGLPLVGGFAMDITERRRMETALRENESVLRSFFESGPMMMGVVDVTEDDIIHISDNRAAAALVGSTPEQMRGRRDRDLDISAERRLMWKRHYHESERLGRPVRFDYSFTQGSGKRWLSVVVSFIARSGEGRSRFSYVAEDVTDREEAKETRERFGLMLEATTDFVGIADKRGRALFVNRAGRELIGLQPGEEINGSLIAGFHPPWAAEIIAREGIPVAMLEGSWSGDSALMGPDGREIPVSQLILAHKSPDGSVEFLSTIMRDITVQKETEQKIKASLEEKEVLLKEIHHRVKNNMQIVSSLLQLQSGYIEDPKAQTIFEECRDRIKSMALIHEQLYQSNDLAQIDFPEYLRNLVSMIFAAHRPRAAASAQLESRLRVDPIALDLDTAIPVGLMANELVTNCLKYAFAGRDRGTVTVELRPRGGSAAALGRYTLTVRDDGMGLPESFSFAKATSLGLRLVRILAKQIGGELEYSNGTGSEFRVHFPAGKV